MDPPLVALVLVAALVASTMAGMTGLGGGVILLPALIFVFGVRDAIPTLAASAPIGLSSLVWFNRRETSLAVVKWFALGAVPGAVLGGTVFVVVPAAVLVRLLGAFLLLVVVYRHTALARRTRITLRGFLPLGVVVGFLTAIVGPVGPVMAPFFLAYGLLKGAFIGTLSLGMLLMELTKLSVYGGYALVGGRTLLMGMAIGVVSVVGAYVGGRIMRRLSERVFTALTEALLLTFGLLFLVRN